MSREASRRRPAVGGDSISHYRGGAATLGCLVVGRATPRQLYLLCDASGLTDVQPAPQVGDPILQPGRADGGLSALDAIATLAQWTRPSADNSQAADNLSVALAQVRRREDVSPEIKGRGTPQGVESAIEGLTVFGVGRSSGEVQGTILQVGAAEEILWPIGQIDALTSSGDGSGYHPILFGDLIVTTPMVEAGDSGMVLLDQENHALALAFAGGNDYSLFIPLQKILDKLEVELVTAEVWQSLS
jgi:hypothetical protein